jgi:hypothetical protein
LGWSDDSGQDMAITLNGDLVLVELQSTTSSDKRRKT